MQKFTFRGRWKETSMPELRVARLLATVSDCGSGFTRNGQYVVTKTLFPTEPGRMGLPSGVVKKLMTVMKMTAFILLVTCLHVAARTSSQTVTISGKEMALKKVFNDVKKQTGFSVFGNANLWKQTKPVSISVIDMSLSSFLDQVLKDQPITYRLVNRTIVLYSKSAPPVFGNPLTQLSEKISISDKLALPVKGTVVDQNGNPLAGVTVKIKGTNSVVITDNQGVFLINADPDDMLQFSYVGMASFEIKASSLPSSGRISLKPGDATLSDVVVTGYGNIKKESFTGTYTQVTKADIQRVSSNNLISALQTFDPSFRIQQNLTMGSNPNVMPQFYIRGQSGFPGLKELDRLESSSVSQFSLRTNPNTPVFIMDGFEVSVEKVYDLDINRINNITILKDAAATAMYGSRASNGVVVIETILPKAGEFRMNYNGNYSVTAPDLSSYSMMNAEQKLAAETAAQIHIPTLEKTHPAYQSDLIDNLWSQQQKQNEVLKGVNTHWLSKPLSTMFNHKHNVFIEGGSQAVRVGLELKYDQQNGVMKESFRQRVGAGLTLQYQTSKLQIRNQTYFDAVAANESPYGKFSDYSRLQPYYPIYDEITGEYLRTFPVYYGRTVVNPLHEATVGNFSKNRYKEWTNNFTSNWYITNALFIRGQIALDLKQENAEQFISPESNTYPAGNLFAKGDLSQSSTTTLDWNTNLFASYNKMFNKDNLNLSAGINAKSTTEEFGVSGYRGFPGAKFHSPAYAYEILTKPRFNDNKRRLFGTFATANYSLNNIFLFDASVRLDGSSEFGTDKKWAPFWSAGSGINLHNTSLLRKRSYLDLFRITANIGQTGKSNFSPYMARNTYELMLDDWYPTGIGAGLIYLGNNNLTWEKQVSYNIGTMLSVLKRFTFEFNYYNKETYDLITDVSLPSSSGFSVYRDNIGKVINKGFEIKTTASIINTKNFNFTLIGNLAHNNNRIVEIAQSLKQYNSRIDEYYKGYAEVSDPINALIFQDLNLKYARPLTKYEEGSSLTTIFGMKSAGINPANGREIFIKRDGTVTYDWDPIEQQPIGNTEPVAQGTFGVNARFKRFSLYTTFLYEWGGDQYNQTLVDNVENVNLRNYNADTRVLTQRWQKPGDITSLKAIQDRYFITRPTSRFVQRNNYISFNSFSLTYDFDVAHLRSFGIRTLRTSFMMNDIGFYSTMKREMGLDYPFARTFNLMITASF